MKKEGRKEAMRDVIVGAVESLCSRVTRFLCSQVEVLAHFELT